jgi:hypothetical protein
MTRGVLRCGVDGVDTDACRLVRELSARVGSTVDDLGFGVDALLSVRTDSPKSIMKRAANAREESTYRCVDEVLHQYSS